MEGAAHQLKADPQTGKVQLNSEPGFLKAKLQSIGEFIVAAAQGVYQAALTAADAADAKVAEWKTEATKAVQTAIQTLEAEVKERLAQADMAVKALSDKLNVNDFIPALVQAAQILTEDRVNQSAPMEGGPAMALKAGFTTGLTADGAKLMPKIDAMLAVGATKLEGAGPPARKNLPAAKLRATEVENLIQPGNATPRDQLLTQVKDKLDLVANALTETKLKALDPTLLDVGAIADQAAAEKKFKEEPNWKTLKDKYAEKDQSSMWRLWHFRKAWVDATVNSITDNKAKMKWQAMGSENIGSDYDISLWIDPEQMPPELLQPAREKQGGDEGALQQKKARETERMANVTPLPEIKQEVKGAEIDKAKLPELAKSVSLSIKEFNDKARGAWGVEPGIVFDTNLYDRGETLPAAMGQTPPLHNEASQGQKGGPTNAEIQDVAALTKVRMYIGDDGPDTLESAKWTTYCNESQEGLPPAVATTLAGRQAQANDAYQKAEQAIRDKIKELKPTEENDDKKVHQTAQEHSQPPAAAPPGGAQPAAGGAQGGGHEDPQAAQLRMQAKNQIYQEKVAAIDELRVKRDDQIKEYKKKTTKEEKDAVVAEIDKITVDIRKLTAEALLYAAEAYNSQGAMVDVVHNQQIQGGKEKDFAKIKTTVQEKLQSFNEQFGDITKDLVSHAAPGRSKWMAAIDAAKYVERFSAVGVSLCQDIEYKKGEDDLAEIKADNAILVDARKNPAMRGEPDPRPGKDLATLEANLTKEIKMTPEQYQEKYQKLNIDVQREARKFLADAEAKQNAGGAGGAPPAAAG
jgi:hypothetical protein